MMNDEKDTADKINGKIKKYAIALGSCALIFAVFAVVASNIRTSGENDALPVTDENIIADAEKNDVPDTRGETIVVPATEITTLMIEVTDAMPANEATAEETAAASAAPDSYILPLGTDIGKDYSQGVPVYSSVMSDWRTHDGVDFNGAYGDGVKAIADGTVKDVKTDALMGDIVVIDHGGGVVASYCGVTADSSVIKGKIMSKGDKIGEISEIPCETDAEYPHLHLEIRVDGEISDPLEVMNYYE